MTSMNNPALRGRATVTPAHETHECLPDFADVALMSV